MVADSWDVEDLEQPVPIESNVRKKPRVVLLLVMTLCFSAFGAVLFFFPTSLCGPKVKSDDAPSPDVSPSFPPTPVPTASSNHTPTPSSPSVSPLFIAIPSGARPENSRARQHWRKTCTAKLREHGLSYAFYIGRPSDDNRSLDRHVWEEMPTPNEKLWSTALQKEQQEYQDMVFVPMRDHYLDLTDKTLHMLKDGFASGSPFVVKVDDDTCFDPTILLEFHRKHVYEDKVMLYCGENVWNHKDVSFAAGPLYAVSHNLLARIFSKELNAYVNLYSMYGSTSEDKNLGFWVDHVSKTCTDQCKVERKILKMAYAGKHR